MGRITPRVAAGSGLVFAVLFAVGLLLSGNVPSDATDQKAVEFYADSGNRIQLIIAAYCLMLSVLCFLPFLIHMRDKLAAAPRSAAFAPVVFGAGLLFAATTIVGAIAMAWLPAGIVFGGAPDVQSADLARMAPQLAYGIILAGGGLCAFAMLGTASVAALRSDAWASWLAWAGIVVAVLQIVDVAFLPYFLLLLWVLVASVILIARGSEGPALAAAQSA